MEVIEILDQICENAPSRDYKNKHKQLTLALISYIKDDDNSLFYNSKDRNLIKKVSPNLVKSEIIKNVIVVYNIKRENFSNKVTYINKLPKDFNVDDLEFSINSIFNKGGPMALDIYLNSFDTILEKSINHFINSRYSTTIINKNSIKQYFKNNEILQLDFRQIDEYYKQKDLEQTKITSK